MNYKLLLILFNFFVINISSQNCDDILMDNIYNPGPYNYATILESDGMRDGPDYFGATLYYPVDYEGYLPSLILVPGFVSPESTVSEWGPYLASHGYIVMTIGTNTLTDLPQDRANALLDAAITLQEENDREDSPVFQQVDISKIAVGGHSMGGGGAQIAATLNSSLKSIISLTPWIQQWLVSYDYLDHSVPLLIISGQSDTTAPVESHANIHYDYTPNSTPKAIYEIENGNHSVGNYPTTANNYVGKLVLSWLNYFLIEDNCYFPLLLEYPEQASSYINNLETFNIIDNQNSKFKIYPNPVEDYLNIISDNFIKSDYYIFNKFGQIVSNGKINGYTTSLDIAHLPSGIYLLKFQNETFKIIKK
jgi:dienelactone hydrolase